MKNFLALLVFCFGVSLSLSAQIIPSVGMHGYLTERVDFANIDVAEVELEGRSGWHAGLDFRLSKKALYLQPGVHYYQTNSRVTDLREIDVPQNTFSQKHTALKVPVLAGLRLGLNGTAAIHLQGGPVATVSIKEKLYTDLGGQRDLAFGLATGVAVDLLRFNIHARYEWGMTQAFENQPGNADVLSVGVGLVF